MHGRLTLNALSLMFLLTTTGTALAAPSTPSPVAFAQDILATPEAKLDLAKTKIAIDRLIDPSIEDSDVLRRIDDLASQIRARIPAGASQRTKLEILIDSLKQAGPWNDYRPFRYDLDDPFGKDIRNKLLSTYLATRKGNCVSMPVLLVIVGQKIGLDATLSAAPHHLFARVKTDGGVWMNVEATSFGAKADSGYQTDFRITKRAMQSGIYLRTLTHRQSAGVMLETLMEHYNKAGSQERRLALANTVLRFDPKNVAAMLHKGSACSRLINQRYIGKYQSAEQMSQAQRQDFETLGRCNANAFSEAEALGWREEDRNDKANYRHSIDQVKSNQGRKQ